MKKLPIGIQSIGKILSKRDYVYVDKTGFIKKLLDEGSPHYFIARPRRFGKSLFVSTLEKIFMGDKDLFKGLVIHQSDYDWKKYPVIRFDFSKIINRTAKEFEEGLKRAIKKLALSRGISIDPPTIQEGLDDLIKLLSEAKNSKVVVLVDEYDKPIVDPLEDPRIAEENKEILKGFFETLKSLDEYLKLSFITGVSKFSQVSIFSGLNNLNDITMNQKYAGMLGYTEEELRKNFEDHIHAVVNERCEQGSAVTQDDIIDELRVWYNGYRFSEGKICVYNPFSTLKFMQIRKPKAYWYSTGTPSFLINQLKKHSKSMVSLDGTTATEEDLMDNSTLDPINLEVLMYQTGYFTIKDYNNISKRYLLGLPNEEVRSAFINSLVQNFASITKVRASEKYEKALEEHKPDFLFKQIEIGLSSFAYQVFVDAKERTYQGMLLSMLYGMGFDPISERSTNIGRIDVVLEIPSTTYIIEVKLDSSADKALNQIHEKGYYKLYTQKGKEIVIIGANFSSKNRNISDWKGELLSESGDVLRELFPEIMDH